MHIELKTLLSAVREAGQMILTMRREGLDVEFKESNELLTAADLRANDMLKSALLKQFPQDGWLSEETRDNGERLTKSRVWIVDPIDGTIEYAKDIAEYAISVALIEKGEAIMGAVYNPASNEFFHAVKGQGAWLNDQPIQCSNASSKEKMILLASRSENARGKWERFKLSHDVRPVGSIAYKLGLIAAGLGDATFSLGPKNEWDIAAGVLIVTEAGGCAVDCAGQPYRFNQCDTLVNGIVASAGDVVDEVMALIRCA